MQSDSYHNYNHNSTASHPGRNLDDPDDFYRPYQDLAQGLDARTHHPDILVADPSVRMATVNQWNTPAAVPTRYKSSIPSPQSSSRPSYRSASGPASSHAARLGGTKSNPSLSVAGRRQGSVKELVNNFNQAGSSSANIRVQRSRQAGPRTGSSTTPTSSDAFSPVSDSSQARNAHDIYSPVSTPQSRQSAQFFARSTNDLPRTSNPSQHFFADGTSQPLFGEVLPSNGGALDPGYGILAFDRRESDGGLAVPSPKLGHGRSQSNQETSPSLGSGGAMDGFLPSTTYSPNGHKRSQSDATANNIPPYRPNLTNQGGLSKISNALQSTAPSNRQHRPAPASRIPISRRRTSLTSDSSSSIPSSRAGSALGHTATRGASPVAARSTPSRTANRKESDQSGRPSTPPTKLSVKRYDASPNKVAANSPSLKAYISAPTLKKSPPLRNSRPRQPVSAASTSSSRAKISERFGATTRGTPGQRRDQSRPKHLRDIGEIDFAGRRARIEKAMSQKIEEDDLREAAKQAAEKAAMPERNPSKLGRPEILEPPRINPPEVHETTVHVQDAIPPSGRADSDTMPQLSVAVDDLSKAQSDEPTTGATEFETDDSPILGLPGAFPEPDRKTSPPPQIQFSHPPSGEAPFSASFDHDFKATDNAPAVSDGQPSASKVESRFLHGNYGMNGGISGEPGSFLGNDSESIRVMLGATPALERNDAVFADSGYRHSQNNDLGPNSGTSSIQGVSFLDDDRHHSGDSVTDLESLHPSDSASIAFRNDSNSHHSTSRPNSRRMTLDAESVGTINRLLGQFYDSGHATPGFLKEFQREVAKASPDLARKLDSEPEQAIQVFFEGLFQEANANSGELLNFGESLKDSSEFDRATPPDTDDAESMNEPPGTAIIYPTTSRYSGEVFPSSSVPELQANLGVDAHSGDYRPPPPPKDRGYSPSPRSNTFRISSPPYVAGQHRDSTALDAPGQDHRAAIPSLEGKVDDLGLAIQVQPPPQDSPTIPDTLPPLPAHQPPPPPLVPPATTGYHFDPSDRDSPISHNVHNVSILPDALAHSFAPSPGPVELSAESKPGEGGMPSSAQGSPTRDSVDRQAGPTADKNTSPTPDQQRLKQRLHVIQEIVTTENTYCRDMTIVEDIYKATASACKDLGNEDIKGIFGNSDKVLAFTEDFRKALRAAVKPVYSPPKDNRWRTKRASLATSNSKSTDQSTLQGVEMLDDECDRRTRIGCVFNEHLPRMEKVYQDYVLNYFYVDDRLKKLEARPGVSIWLTQCHEYARDITDAWNLPTLLIKPSQRLLKYPLLLTELLKVTPSDHPDHDELKQALENVKKACDRVDAAKERSILIDQVANRKRKDSDVRMGLTKAFARRTEKLKQQVGLSDSVEDWEYRKIEQKYGGHVLWAECVRRDADLWVKDLYGSVERYNALAAAMESMIDVWPTQNPEIESKWRKFAIVVREITSIAMPEHIAAIGKNVYSPVEQLNKILQHVSSLMEKRKKRILDYAKYKALLDRGDKIDKKTAESGKQWIALNDTLKDELPKLYPLIKKTCRECGLNLTRLMMEWHFVVESKLKTVLEEQQIPKEISEIEPAFRGDHDIIQAQLWSLGICNGSLLADSSNFLSPTTTMRSGSLNGEGSPMPIPELSSKFPGASTFSPFPGAPATTPSADGQSQQSPQYRYRANSNVSSRGPSTPATAGNSRNLSANTLMGSYFPPRPSTATGHHDSGSTETSRQSTEQNNRTRPQSGSNSFSSSSGPRQQSQSNTPGIRSSAVFSSAMPLPDSPGYPQQYSGPTGEDPKPQDTGVLFLAASLFEFNIDRARREGGYPYLTYVAGEVFDVIGQKGELWLARNQDDATRQVGWIWEKHFARLPPQ
ncbi:hypothetical protein EV356DRAFT_170097 [Viridothelium virens]|uniref:DH domain-containing protein n=1 Tax=Viridothelium virens TaxID=1048519 RepID=A0A6A6HP41_VIRVR|nr:hypothetical protein EV356DRAFT_170097 [Viridothelium virens]